jgi:hypothetical protein
MTKGSKKMMSRFFGPPRVVKRQRAAERKAARHAKRKLPPVRFGDQPNTKKEGAP